MLQLNKPPSSEIKYKFYATLLDSYEYYLKSEYDDAFQGFIDKLNRVKFTSEAAEKGTAFNKLVDAIKNGELCPVDVFGAAYKMRPGAAITVSEKGLIRYGNFSEAPFTPFEFKWNLVQRFVEMFEGSYDQVYIEAVLDTPKGKVLLYGFIDEMMRAGIVSDIKTSKHSYEFPQFLHNWQHKVYLYCLNEQGIFCNTFRYDFTDFTNHVKEDYQYNPADKAGLVDVCMGLISFVETHREKITDLKVFNKDVPKEANATVAQ